MNYEIRSGVVKRLGRSGFGTSFIRLFIRGKTVDLATFDLATSCLVSRLMKSSLIFLSFRPKFLLTGFSSIITSALSYDRAVMSAFVHRVSLMLPLLFVSMILEERSVLMTVAA